MRMTFEIEFIENGRVCKTYFSGVFNTEEEGKNYVLDFFGFRDFNPNLALVHINKIQL